MNRLWLFAGAACVAGTLSLVHLQMHHSPPASPRVETTETVPTTLHVDAKRDEVVLASTNAAPAHLPAVNEEPAPSEPTTLDVAIDGHRVSWTTDDIRAVRRAGGTHDIRELAAALIGTTDATVKVAGETLRGERSAKVNLKTLGATDQLRIWPESDGTWTIARNLVSEDGRATTEQYSLTGVRNLDFKRN